MDGVNTTWSRVKDGASISGTLTVIKRDFDAEEPERSVRHWLVYWHGLKNKRCLLAHTKK